MNFTWMQQLPLLVWAIALGGLFFVSWTAWKGHPTVDTANTLTIGLSSGYPPYELLSSTGELEGFDIDIAHAVGEKLGKKVIIKDMLFDTLIMELQQGKLDLLISGMSITPERLKKLFMIHYQGKTLTHLSLMFWETIPQGISSLKDFEKYPQAVVCVQPGTIHEVAMKQYPTVHLSYLDVPQMVMDLMYKKSLAALLEDHVVEEIKAQHPAIQILHVPLPSSVHSLGNGIAVDKKQADLAKQVEKAIEELKADGTISTLENKWFKESSYGSY